MIRVCYSKHHIGDRKFGEKAPFEDKSETSGVCEECFPKEMENIRATQKLLKDLGWKSYGSV